MFLNSIRKIFSTITFIILFSTSAKSSSASELVLNSQDLNLDSPEIKNNNLRIAQTCEEGRKQQQYMQVVTQQGEALEIRSSPDGRVIGAVPSGWHLVYLRQDATGRWTQITDHHSERFGESFFEGPSNFRSAPLFRRGWVRSSSLKNVGQHCGKPSSLQSSYLLMPQMNLEIQIYEDWLQLGDKIAKAS